MFGLSFISVLFHIIIICHPHNNDAESVQPRTKKKIIFLEASWVFNKCKLGSMSCSLLEAADIL